MAGRNMFTSPFLGLARSKVVKPITIAMRYDEIPQGEIGSILKQAVPRGYVGTSPQVVKLIDGEFLVNSNGTAQFVPLGRAPGMPFPI